MPQPPSENTGFSEAPILRLLDVKQRIQEEDFCIDRRALRVSPFVTLLPGQSRPDFSELSTDRLNFSAGGRIIRLA